MRRDDLGWFFSPFFWQIEKIFRFPKPVQQQQQWEGRENGVVGDRWLLKIQSFLVTSVDCWDEHDISWVFFLSFGATNIPHWLVKGFFNYCLGSHNKCPILIDDSVLGFGSIMNHHFKGCIMIILWDGTDPNCGWSSKWSSPNIRKRRCNF